MAFKGAANIDPNHHKGLILSNSITNNALVATGLSLTNAQPIHVAIVDSNGSQVVPAGSGSTGDINIKQVNGATVNVGTGTASTGTQRVAVASDSSINAVQSGTWNITNVSGTISLPTGAATSANQSTEITSLASIVTNTTGLATSANQTNGNQQSRITNGTNVADVVANDSGYNGMVDNEGTKTLTASSTGTGAQVLFADTDVRGYASVRIVWSAVGSGLAATAQFANSSGGTYANSSHFTQGASATTFPGNSGISSGVRYIGPIIDNFFRLNITALTSGTATVTVTFSTAPFVSDSTTTQGNKTNNNAAPAATQLDVMPGLANAAQQSWTEGNSVKASFNLKGAQRMIIQDAALNDRGVNVDTNNNLQVGQATAANLNATVVGTGTFATQVTANPLVTSPLVGQSKIAVTGTAVQLNGGTSQVLTNGIIISAPSGNTNPILIGASSVTNTADGTGNGYALAPGASISFAMANTNDLWINGHAGDYVSWAGS